MRVSVRGAWEIGSTLIVVIAAVAMSVFYFHDRKVFGSRENASNSTFTSWEDWEEWDGVANRIGRPDASTVIAVFSDFNCPFCRVLVPVLDSVALHFSDKIALDHYHFPLSRHELAVPSAVAVECADRQAKFNEMYHELFSQMDSIGVKPFPEIATDAGVPDRLAFERCVEAPMEEFPKISAARNLGMRLGVRTPTIWINGTVYLGERSFDAFRKHLDGV
jgi:protein-disulfide isomerase